MLLSFFQKLNFNTDAKLIIKVKENPIINRIALEGNKRLDDEDILSEITIKIRDVFTKNKIQNNLQKYWRFIGLVDDMLLL